jgi:hypothetical protein
MKCPGIWPGIVVSNEDIDRKGKLLIRIPQIHGSDTDAEKIADDDIAWARPCFPFVGKDSGFAMVPEADAGVWVMFVGGDPRLPVWMGGWFGNADKLDDHFTGYQPGPKAYVLKTPLGHKMVMQDEPDANITLETKLGHSLTMQDEPDPSVVLQDLAEQKLELDTKTILTRLFTPGQMVISAGLAMTITALFTLTMAVTAAMTITVGGILAITVAGAVQILSTNLILGVIVDAKKLCNLEMMTLYNSHTHSYDIPTSSSGSGPTGIPGQQGVEDTHTTKNVRAS